MSFPRYPKYKQSGVEWLPEIPGHWVRKSLGKVTREKCDGPFGSGLKSEHYVDAGVRVIRLQNIRSNGFDSSNEAFIAEDYYRSQLSGHDVRDGDLLIAGLGDENNVVGRACVAPRGIEPALVKADCFRFRLDESSVEPRFVALQLTANAAVDAGLLSSGSTRSRIPLSVMASRQLAIPPRAEQRDIVAFLDREIAKIDALVSEQQRLIELLKEKRQAVISHAVTKGLNPDAPMKPSGIEWLGDVPAHWDVGSLKRYWRVTDCKHVTAEFVDEGIPLVSIREVQSRWIDLAEAKQTTEQFYQLLTEGGRDPVPGDLIFSRNATVGEVAQVPDRHPRFALGQDVVLLRRLLPECSPDYLQHVIRSTVVTGQLANLMIGSTFKRINVEEIKGLVVPWPPSDEQHRISSYLESELEKIDALMASAQKASLLLQERRTALISAAVTGQIDVRELAKKKEAA